MLIIPNLDANISILMNPPTHYLSYVIKERPLSKQRKMFIKLNKEAGSTLGYLQVNFFSWSIHVINSPHQNKFIGDVDFFQQVTKTLGRPL